MANDDPRNRFQNIREEYDDSTSNSDDDKSQESNDGQDSNAGQDSTAGIDSTTSTDTESSARGLKVSRKSVQAYVPPEEKENLEDSWRRLKALCNLAGEAEPPKNDFYTAVLREGYTNFAAVAASLELEDAYEQYGDVVN